MMQQMSHVTDHRTYRSHAETLSSSTLRTSVTAGSAGCTMFCKHLTEASCQKEYIGKNAQKHTVTHSWIQLKGSRAYYTGSK